MTRWTIDEEQIVHNAMCKAASGQVVHYVTKPKTNGEMLEHLSRADRKDRHDLPSMLQGCLLCIPSDQESL